MPLALWTAADQRFALLPLSPSSQQVHGIRKAMVSAFQAAFADLHLTCSIGGQISFDVFPNG